MEPGAAQGMEYVGFAPAVGLAVAWLIRELVAMLLKKNASGAHSDRDVHDIVLAINGLQIAFTSGQQTVKTSIESCNDKLLTKMDTISSNMVRAGDMLSKQDHFLITIDQNIARIANAATK